MILMCGPNVIESEQHTLALATSIKQIAEKYDLDFYFKTSFDKANRSSLSSYRGPGFEKGLSILKNVREQAGVKIITDIHEPWQAGPAAEVADILQIPAFLCRQTDLLKAAAETGKTIHVKKGQFCSAEQMHKCKEKIIAFGNTGVILCERGNSFGYQDLVVDPRNLVWLKSDTNLVSMDITHSLQTPSQKSADGIVKCGGYRDLIPYMGKMAIALGVDAIFMEVHDNPDAALCDGPTQWPLDKLDWLLGLLGVAKKGASKHVPVEKCVLCKRGLASSETVYDGEIRGDPTNKCRIVECGHCSHIQLTGSRANLRQHYDEDEQSNDIVKTFNITKEDIIRKEIVEIGRRMKYLKVEQGVPCQVLDVGSGYCSFAKRLSDEYDGVSVTCLEPSRSRTELGAKINLIASRDNICILNAYLDEDLANENQDRFDIVTSWHVFEHLDEDHIDRVLQNMYKCCKPGGRILIEVPNSRDELLKTDRYKRINYMVHHISYWNESSLSKLCANNAIESYSFEYVQRYGLSNYLNWTYNLGEKQDLDMNDDRENLAWLNAKRKAKNTDAILLIIRKPNSVCSS